MSIELEYVWIKTDMPRKAPLILFNPSAGMGRALRQKERLEGLLRHAELSPEFVVTESGDHLRTLARREARRGGTVVGAGGDSTFHIIVNEIMSAGGESAFGMIGLGSSNDIARAFGLEPLERAVAAIKAGRTQRVDLGCLKQGARVLCFFLGQANIGLGATVNRYIGRLALRRPWLARRQTLAGLMGIIEAYRKHRIPLVLKVRAGKKEIEGAFLAAVFSNTRYWATGKTIAPRARPDDGRLDACLIGTCSFLRLARINALAVNGLHGRAPEVRLLQAREFDVAAAEPFDIQADGEVFGVTRPGGVQFRVKPRALRMIS